MTYNAILEVGLPTFSVPKASHETCKAVVVKEFVMLASALLPKRIPVIGSYPQLS